MKYYKLNSAGTNWDLVDVSNINIDDYRQISLYDNNLDFTGTGLY